MLIEKVDALTLAAMQAGDETADFEAARTRLWELLNEPLPSRYMGRNVEESELRLAIGLSA